jgi:hypothetical protein
VSAITHLNRWYRYQQARIDGLVTGLHTEAHNLGRNDLDHEVAVLANELRETLARQMLTRRASLRDDTRLDVPDICFERL